MGGSFANGSRQARLWRSRLGTLSFERAWFLSQIECRCKHLSWKRHFSRSTAAVDILEARS